MPRYHSPGFEPIEVVVINTTRNYSMAISDQIVEFNLTTPSAIAVTGPNNQMPVGKIYTIKDGAGNAASNSITFTPGSGTGTIDGASSFVINTNNGSLSFYFDGQNLKIVNSGGGGGGGTTNQNIRNVGIQINGQGSVISPGLKGFVIVPYAATITGWELVADQSGSIIIDVWKVPIASVPATVANTITGSDLPNLSSQIQKSDTTLTGWGNTAINAGDVIYFNVNSATTVTQVNLILIVKAS